MALLCYSKYMHVQCTSTKLDASNSAESDVLRSHPIITFCCAEKIKETQSNYKPQYGMGPVLQLH